MRIDGDLPDHRYLFLGDILPTAWQGVEYCDLPEGGSIVVLGLGPVGQLAARIAAYRGFAVQAVDPVPERREMAERHGIQTHEPSDDLAERLRASTGGRGPDAVIDAVGVEADGDPVAAAVQATAGLLPKPAARAAFQKAGVDRLAALGLALDLVRRGGTVSLTGVYTGAVDPLPLGVAWDKELTLRMGPVNVRRWLTDLVPLVEDPDDPLGLDDLVTHRLPIERAPEAYEMFQAKADGCVKVVFEFA